MKAGKKWFRFALTFFLFTSIISVPFIFAENAEGAGFGGSPGDDEPLPDLPPDEPTGPSQEDIDQALAALAAELGIDVSELTDDQINEVIDNLTAAWEEANGKQGGTGGDPVLISTGRYVLDTTDIKISGSKFGISRKYISDEKTTGSFGNGWLVSFDSRIIRGITKTDSVNLQKAEELTQQLQNIYHQISTGYIADYVYNSICLPAMNKLQNMKSKKQRSDQLSALNQFARFAGQPSYYEEIGTDKLTLIDENGIPVVFEPAGTGIWKPVSNPEQLFMRIESKDGKGTESKAGFLLYGRGGTVSEYDGNGLLAGITGLDGSSIKILRDDKARAIRITGPHNDEWQINYSGNFVSSITGPEMTRINYGYSGDKLVWVEDSDGDTVRFAWDNGRLVQIIKPDGSAIKLQYGYSNAAGTFLVTATVNEEGYSEKFDYDPARRQTVYTNYSGIITRYLYDENHRTVQEANSGGRIKTYGYNSSGLLDYENANGFETRYRYDLRGNITEKSYSDGKRENWEWNGSDQVTRYSDRDSIITEWIYDYSGNCTEILRGGIIIYSGLYDDMNRLVSSREGEQSEINYGYNNQDYLSSRTRTVNGRVVQDLWEYDGLGRVVKYTDPLGRIWKYEYLQKETVETHPSGLEKRYFYNNRKDVVRIADKDLITGEERTINIEYNLMHRPIRTINGEGNTTEYEYRADGKLVKKTQGPWFWEYSYDEGGRTSGVTTGMADSGKTYTENFSYAWQSDGTQYRELMQPGAGVSGYRLDPWGRITSITNPLNETSTRILNAAGNAIREQAEAGGFFEYSFDALGRLTEAGREGERPATVKYNTDGSIAEKTDRLGNTTVYNYDGGGYLTGETNALGEERYYYDPTGRIVKKET
ncbi:MAG: DUF6531 domain-containing protein, partial [Treponema sp.]|nr:DUF6531 domain-containing protein [Treponema sp.]